VGKLYLFLLLRVVGYKAWRGRVEGGKGNENGKEGEWKGRRRKGGKGEREERRWEGICRTDVELYAPVPSSQWH